jgi:hypothetical protein
MSVVFVAFLFLCFFPLYLISVATKEQRDCYFSKLFIYSLDHCGNDLSLNYYVNN